MYTKAAARLKVDGREEPYLAETDIDPARNLEEVHLIDARYALEQQNNLVIRDANYTDPMGSDEPVYDGFLELGGTRPAVGGPFYVEPKPVKVLFN